MRFITHFAIGEKMLVFKRWTKTETKERTNRTTYTYESTKTKEINNVSGYECGWSWYTNRSESRM